MSKSSGIRNADDAVTAVILVEPGYFTYNVSIVSNNKILGARALLPGYNSYSVSVTKVGNVTVKVVVTLTRATIVKREGGTSPISMLNSSNLCNYNFQVVALSWSGG